MQNSRRWYTIYTKPRQEDRAHFNLSAWGLETFAPKIRERRLQPYSNQPRHIIKPLFVSYIFARFDAGELLHKVWYTRGVQNVVSYGGRPIPVEDETIQLIQFRLDPDGYVRLNDELQTGDEVLIKEGSFRGMHGVFDRNISESDRVSILLSQVMYPVQLIVEKSHVQKVFGNAA
jgi:transcriptional antiterminator RfaH